MPMPGCKNNLPVTWGALPELLDDLAAAIRENLAEKLAERDAKIAKLEARFEALERNMEQRSAIRRAS